jgi:uncharacterized protein
MTAAPRETPLGAGRPPQRLSRRQDSMAIDVYDQIVPVMHRMLTNLSTIVQKAETYAQARSIDPNALLQARLYPDMFNLIRQVQLATDFAKGAAARLSGTEVPKWEDTEQTFAELQARIQRGRDYLDGFTRESFAGAEQRSIEIKLPSRTLKFTGQEYLLSFALPNFYFHVTMAYAILRHNGLEIGKLDFMGG